MFKVDIRTHLPKYFNYLNFLGDLKLFARRIPSSLSILINYSSKKKLYYLFAINNFLFLSSVMFVDAIL